MLLLCIDTSKHQLSNSMSTTRRRASSSFQVTLEYDEKDGKKDYMLRNEFIGFADLIETWVSNPEVKSFSCAYAVIDGKEATNEAVNNIMPEGIASATEAEAEEAISVADNQPTASTSNRIAFATRISQRDRVEDEHEEVDAAAAQPVVSGEPSSADACIRCGTDNAHNARDDEPIECDEDPDDPANAEYGKRMQVARAKRTSPQSKSAAKPKCTPRYWVSSLVVNYNSSKEDKSAFTVDAPLEGLCEVEVTDDVIGRVLYILGPKVPHEWNHRLSKKTQIRRVLIITKDYNSHQPRPIRLAMRRQFNLTGKQRYSGEYFEVNEVMEMDSLRTVAPILPSYYPSRMRDEMMFNIHQAIQNFERLA